MDNYKAVYYTHNDPDVEKAIADKDVFEMVRFSRELLRLGKDETISIRQRKLYTDYHLVVFRSAYRTNSEQAIRSMCLFGKTYPKGVELERLRNQFNRG